MRRTLIASGVAVIIAALAAWWLVGVRYEVYALLKVAARQPEVFNKRPDGVDEYQTFKRTQVQLILSPGVLRCAISEPQIAQLQTVQEHKDEPYSWLKNQLIIDYPDDAEILRVAIRGKRPNDLIAIANMVVKKYLTEVVQNERLKRLANEAELGKRYEEYRENLTRQMDALHKMEQVARVGSKEAADVHRKLALSKLDEALARRARLRMQLDDNAMQLKLLEAREEEGTRTATVDPAPPAQAAPNLSAHQLAVQKEYLERQLDSIEKTIEEEAEAVQDIERFSAEVATKQEELRNLRTITNELGTELQRSHVERMAMERITKVDDAILVSPRGDALRKNVAASLAVGLGLALVALGMVMTRRRPVSPIHGHEQTD